MATKDFKVKNGLTVAEGIRVDSGSIIVAGLEVINSSGGVVGVYQGFDSDFSSSILNTTTDSLSEGLNNLYYTTSRVDSAFDARLATKTTNDVTEGSNLYYTTSRVDSAFDIRLALKNTGDLSEGSNLYYTTARVDSAFDARLATKTTDDLTEGANQYYTDTRVQTYLSNNSYATLFNIDSAIAALVDAAPSQLNTLNELAAAINDDSNFAATVNNQLSLKLNTADFSSTANNWISGKSTSDLSEGSNLYYTTARVDSAFDARLATKTTDDLTEGNNLYYTASRFDSAFSQKTTSDLTEGSNLYYTKSRTDSDISFLVNSSYIENLRPAEVIFEVSNNLSSSYTFLGDGFPVSSNNPDLYVQRGMTYKFKISTTGHPFEIRTSDGGSPYSSGVTNNSVESGDIIFTVPMDAPDTLYYQCTIHSGMGGTIYVTEAASITTDTISEGSANLYYTDARVIALVDSAYIQSRQVDIYRDSAFVTNIIDATYINSLVNATDSTAVINIVTDIIDSAFVTNIIDATYINSLVNATDSTAVINIVTNTIDSAYIQARQLIGGGLLTSEYYFQNYKFIADSNQIIFSGSDFNGNLLSFDSNDFQIYINGIRITDVDYTSDPSNNTITLSTGALLNDEVIISTLKVRAGDVSPITDIIDSAYINARVVIPQAYGDSDVFDIIDSAYINARVVIPQAYGDSDVFDIIDSAYINARVVIPEAGVDSASVAAIAIETIDSAYVSSRVNLSYAGAGSITNYFFTADSGQTTFVGADNNGKILSYTSNAIQVYLNGVLLIGQEDYTANNGSSIILLEPADSGDQLSINEFASYFSALAENMVYQGKTYFKTYSYIADSGQVVFSGSDVNSDILSFDSDNYQVYINGFKINYTDFTANPIDNTINLTLPSNINDEITISVVNNKSLGSEFREILRTEVNDYLPGAIDSYQSVFVDIIDSAYINARVIIPQTYGDSDVFSIIDSAYINARVDQVSGGGGGTWSEVTTNKNIVAGEKLILDTSSSSITVTLPATANLGDEIRIIDGTGNASTNNIIINRNGHLIQGNDSDLTIDIDRAGFGLVYYNSANGWLFTEV